MRLVGCILYCTILCIWFGDGAMYNNSFTTRRLRVDGDDSSTNADGGMFSLLPNDPDKQLCQEWLCMANNFESVAIPGEYMNLLDMFYEFGDIGGGMMESLYRKIQLQDGNIIVGRFGRNEREFYLTGVLERYMDRQDGVIEVTFSAEKGGFVTVATGITFNGEFDMEGMEISNFHEEEVDEQDQSSDEDEKTQRVDRPSKVIRDVGSSQAATENSIVSSRKDVVHHQDRSENERRLARRLNGFVTFVKFVSVIMGVRAIPPIGFLVDHGGQVGVLAVQRFRISNAVYDSVKHSVSRSKGSDIGFRGILNGRHRKDGILVVGAMTFTGKCNGNLVCSVLTKVLRSGSHLEMTYDPGYVEIDALNVITQKRLTATVGNIQINDKIVLRNVGFFTDFNLMAVLYGLTATIRFEVQEGHQVQFRGEGGWQLPESNIHFKMAMIGLWEKVFNIPFLSAGNVQLQLLFNPMTGVIKQARAGGELWIGKAPTHDSDIDRRIKGALFIGFDLLDPTNNYFYASVTNITIQSITNQFTDNVKLPSLIGDTGLFAPEGEDGVLISCSPFMDMTIEDVDPPRIIKRGFRVYGAVQLFHASAMVDITVDWFALAMDMSIEMKPINLVRGLLIIRHSKNSDDLGPKLQMSARFKQSLVPAIAFDGFASILGISVEIHANVSSNGFHFKSNFRVFNLMDAEMLVSWNRKKGDVRVKGEFKNIGGIFDMIEAAATSIIKVLFGRRRLDQLLPRRSMTIDSDSIMMLSDRSKDGNVQTHRRLGFFSNIGDAFKKLGKKIKKGFKKVGKKIKEGFKKVGNKIKEGFKKVGNKIKKVAKKVGKAIGNHFKRVVNKLKENGKKFIEGAKRIGRGDVLGGLFAMGKATLKMAVAISPLGMIHFRINHILFDVDLSKTRNSKTFQVRIEIEVGILDSIKKITFDSKLDLTSPKTIAKSIATNIKLTVDNIKKEDKQPKMLRA